MPRTSLKPEVLLMTSSSKTGQSISKLLNSIFAVNRVDEAEAAWELVLEKQSLTVLICELSSVINDFGLLERIRNANDNRIAAMPLLLLVSESDDDESRESAFRLGATDFINMPFVSSELITRVRLHAQLFVQHASDQTMNVQAITAANVLQQLAQENIFRSRLDQELSFSQRHKTFVSASKIKLDNLHAIVAGFDKKAAISVVQGVASILQQSVRREDTLSYLGNAEFCILYPATNGIGAAMAINRVKEIIASRRIRIAGKQVPVSLSAAIYTDIADVDTDVESVVEVLDQRLREAIDQGGDCIVSNTNSSEDAPISVDQALELIAQQRTDNLSSQAQALMITVMPLLEYADEVLDLDMESVNQSLRVKLK